MIGQHYSRTDFNCAGFVAQWYSEKLNIEIPVVNEFSRSFIVWMAKHFTEVTRPVENCLVLMVNMDGSYHIGVYSDGGVYHNFKPQKGYGAVCKWTLGSVRAYYSKVSFHKWSS